MSPELRVGPESLEPVDYCCRIANRDHEAVYTVSYDVAGAVIGLIEPSGIRTLTVTIIGGACAWMTVGAAGAGRSPGIWPP